MPTAFPVRAVEANQAAVLGFCIDGIGIDGIDLGAEPVAAGGHEPIGIDDAGGTARTRRSAEALVILGASVHIIERKGIIHGDIVELHERQVRLEIPGLGAIPGFVYAAITAHQIMPGVVGIDPNGVIVHVLRLGRQRLNGFSAIVADHDGKSHLVDTIDVLGISDDLGVIHRGTVVGVAFFPRSSAVARAEDAALAVRRFDGRVNDVVIGGRDRDPDATHVDGGQSILQLVPGRARVGGFVERRFRPAVNQVQTWRRRWYEAA